MEERLPQVTRFPQRAKSANPSENAPETGKKQHVKRPSLELVDSHSFVTDEKDKGNSKGPRIIETELSKSELLETVSKQSIEYGSSTTESSFDVEEDTTPLMEKLAIDLYAILANENANQDKSKFDSDITTVPSDEDLTTITSDFEVEKASASSAAPSTSTTTPAPSTTTTHAPTTTTTEAPKGRGGISAGRNRFKFQGKSSSTESPAEPSTDPSKPKNRFSRPSASFSSRNAGSRATKTSATSAPEEVKENVEKSDATQTTSKLGSKTRNRFSLRTQPTTSTTEKSSDNESSTVSRLLKPRPQFSLRNRSRNGAAAASTTESNDVTEHVEEKDDKPAEKSSSIVPRPTSRLNINRPTSRTLPGSKPRTSPLNSRRGPSNDESNDGHKSANENESDLETTTQNNLNKLKSRPRISIDSKAKKTTSPPVVVNRKVNPLISKRKFGVTSTTGRIFILFLHIYLLIRDSNESRKIFSSRLSPEFQKQLLRTTSQQIQIVIAVRKTTPTREKSRPRKRTRHRQLTWRQRRRED